MELHVEEVEMLSEHECLSLLGRERVGRVAVSIGALPAVFPVNYAVAGDQIMFFTSEGTKLRAATANAVVAFEVDHLDAFSQSGWSVLVIGTAREETDPIVIAGVKASGLRPWAGGDRFHLVGLTIDFVSGRRLARRFDPRAAGEQLMAGPQSPVSMLAHPPVRVGLEWSLQEVAHAMREAGVSSVLAGPDDWIVTERDLTRALNAGLGPDAFVTTIAVRDPAGVDGDAPIVDAAAQMLRYDIRHLVIRNHRGEAVGLVSLRDMMRVLLDAMDPTAWVMLRHHLSMASEVRLG